MDSDNRIQDVDVNSSTEVGQTEQKENEKEEKIKIPLTIPPHSLPNKIWIRTTKKGIISKR